MLFKTQKLVDIFIPLNRKGGESRGFAFVKIASKREANWAVDLASGRSWEEGGHR